MRARAQTFPVSDDAISSPYASGVDRQRVSNRRGKRSREEILEAASRIMGQRGYAATPLSVVSNEIGLAKSVIFHHFHTKGGLLSAVMERGMNDFFQAMSAAYADPPAGGTPQERLGWFLGRAAEVLTEREEFLRLHMFMILTEDSDAAEPEVKETIDKVRREGRRHVHHMILESFRGEGPEIAEAVADRLEYIGMAGIDGTFIADQAEQGRSIADDMDLLAETIALTGERLAARMRSAAPASVRPTHG
ncbi:TetR/AcrR family transcriptional regulator [Streptomyces sp. WAC8370]|uniref:TetR/AcrR family transcriptional regulator n=1 Tax=Streptomyces sp. WAC8370 TaxID=3351348 RepID=UPI003F7A1A59